MYVPLAGLGNLTSSLTKASKNILESFAVPSNPQTKGTTLNDVESLEGFHLVV